MPRRALTRPEETTIEKHFQPRLELRSPATGGVIDDPSLMKVFLRDRLFGQSEVHAPTVLLVNLEGRFLTVAALHELVVPVGQLIRSGRYGNVSVIFASPDPAMRDSIKALAESYQLPLYVAASVDRISEAEPVGPLTVGEQETLSLMRRLGGLVTVSQVATATGLDAPAAANRVNAVVGKGFAHRVDRPKSAGHLYVAPWVAKPEDAADPTRGDFNEGFRMRADVSALAALQGREPDDVVAEAVQVFMDEHREQLAADYENIARMMREGDTEGVAEYSKRFAKKTAQAHVRRRDTPK
jgi:hypothetical protein